MAHAQTSSGVQDGSTQHMLRPAELESGPGPPLPPLTILYHAQSQGSVGFAIIHRYYQKIFLSRSNTNSLGCLHVCFGGFPKCACFTPNLPYEKQIWSTWVTHVMVNPYKHGYEIGRTTENELPLEIWLYKR